MSKISLTKKFFISCIFIFLVFFICNKNFSNADFTTAEFIEAVKGVYERAHNNHYAYGNTGTLPPCEDGLIACDRLIARALWDLGVQDQPAGGMTIPIMDEFLTTHGFAKHTNQDEIMPGDIILLNDVKGNTEINANWHTFVIVTYDKNTGMCTKYDTGSGGRIEAIQPFSVPLFEPGYENRDLVAIYRWTGKLGNIGTLGKLIDTETLNYLMENTDISEGKPDTYDIFIDEADLDQDDGMEIPVIQTSIDYILYNNDYLSSIDFFKTNSFDNKATLKHIDEILQNELKTFWERISNLVKDVYKVFLYISVALMITALILIGVIIARRSIASIDKVDEKYTEKKMTEQWIISFISIIMIIVIINLTIAFTAMLSNLTSTYGENETLLDSVKIYAKAYVRSKSNTSGTSANSNGLGTRTDIDENALDKDGNNLASRMAPSLHGQTINSIHDEDGNPLYLTYLTIPYYDFNGQVQQGEMVVHRDLADEVLLIFQELYNKKYPIQRMELVDNFTNKSNGREADDWTSIQANNTSAFNYRKANNGQTDLDTLSLHAYGKCIDINPLVNPYIVNYWANEDHSGAYTTHRIEDGDNGTNSSPNYNDKFIDREGMKEWDETQKKARIWYDTEILAIFQKYGWDWLDRTGNDTDSQHFQKRDTSSAQTIDWSTVNASNNNSGSGSVNYNIDTSNINTSNLVFIGDSRTVEIQRTIASDATFICEDSQGYDWMVGTAFADASTKVYAGKKVIIWLGVNDLGNIENYISAVNEKAKEWTSKGARVYYAEVGPVDYDQYADNPGIEEFNRKLQEGLTSSAKIIKLYDYLKSVGYSTVDGIHYDSETNQKIYDFLVASVNGTASVSGSSTASGSGASTANRPGAVSGTNTATPFTKYQLTDHQLTGLTAVAFSEQGTPEGAAAEASLMANLFETHHNSQCHGVTGSDGLYKMVGSPEEDKEYFWFDRASTYIDTGHLAEYCGAGPVTEEMKAVVKRVLVDGYRTLPLYVDEHDSWSGKDYWAYLNGVDVTYDRSSYIPFVTHIDNKYNSHYTFWGWSNPNYNGSDPFGYTSEERRTEYGEFHYTFDGSAVLGGGSVETIELNFTTNFEGLYMMESNRDWSKNPWQNFFYIICGFILTVFKALLRSLFICRMIIIAILLAVTPIVLIVNAIMKIKGNNGILKGFAIFYAGVLLIKPLLGIIYSIFAKHRPASIADNPFYIMIPVIALTILTIVYFKILAGILSSNK